ARIAAIPGTREVKTSLEEGRPEVRIVVDREKALTYGLTPAQVAQAVRTGLTGEVATQLRMGGEETDIRVQLTNTAKQDMADLRHLMISLPTGGSVQLQELARLEEGLGPVSIVRKDKVRQASVSADL